MKLAGIVPVALAVLAGAALVAACPAVAADEPPGVTVTTDSDGEDDLTVAVADDDSFGGTVTVTNTSATDYDIAVTGAAVQPATCKISVSPDQVRGHRTVALEITSEDCGLADDSAAMLVFEDTTSGVEAGALTLALAGEEKAEGVSMEALLPPFVTGAGLALVPMLLLMVVGYRGRTVQKVDPSDELVWTSADAAGVRRAVTEDVGWTTPVTGVPAGWTFKDSWASNLSVGTTVFVALFGTEDVLDAILGEAPAGSLARLVVAGAIAGLFVGLAPLVLKTIGKSTAPTVGGLIVAGYCTLVGVTGQILATTWILTTDDPGDGPGFFAGYLLEDFDVVSFVALALIAFLLFYGFWTIRTLLHEAFPTPKDSKPAPVPNELVYAAALAASEGWPTSEIQGALQRAKAAAAAVAAGTGETTAEQVAAGQVQLLANPSQLSLETPQQSRLYSGIL